MCVCGGGGYTSSVKRVYVVLRAELCVCECVCVGGGGSRVLYTYGVKHVYVVLSLKHVFVVLSAELCMWGGGGGEHVHTRCETFVRPWCEDYVRGYCSKMMCNVPCASTCVKTN